MAKQTQGGRERRSQRGRRIGLLTVCVLVMGSVYLFRLASLQLPSFYAPGRSELAVQAVRQRQEGLVLDTGRGRIVDRSGEPIAGIGIRALAAFPVADGQRGTKEQIAALAAAIGAETAELTEWLDGIQVPALWTGGSSGLPTGSGGGDSVVGSGRTQQGEAAGRSAGVRRPIRLSPEAEAAAAASGVRGVQAVPYTMRYLADHPAAHAVGYVSEHPELVARLYASELAQGKLRLNAQVGGAGLEHALDRIIRGAGSTVAHHHARQGDRMSITHPTNPYYPLTVVTTLDLALQRKLESYADEAGLRRGAIVVLDAATGDIAAMVSRPAYDPQRIGSSLPDTANRALRAVAPGSVFKLVTEAAALEAKVASPAERFHCDGEHEPLGLSCWLEGGHGTLTLQEALAVSCNVAFAQLAERLTASQLEKTADRLGLGRQVGWVGGAERFGMPLKPLGDEEAGRVFAEHRPERDKGLLAQSGIGQRDVAVTPLQAANLIVTLLHGGEVRAPRIVSELRYANGQRMYGLPVQAAPSRYGSIRRATANALLSGMEKVVAEGTGAPLQRAKWRVAGKSGTAQALENGRPTNHQWFVGYGPVESPRYAVAVLAEHRPAGSANQATAVFRGVMDSIALHEASTVAVR